MSTRRQRAFSFIEVMIVVGLTGLISSGIMAFYIQSLRAGNAGEQQIKLIASMRSFMEELILNGSRAHELILYNSANAADRTAAGRLTVTNDATESVADDICPTGDFAVFVYYELPKPAAQPKYRISRLIGYYVDRSNASDPSLVRITINLASAPSTDPVETILTNNWSTATRRVISEHVTPLALSDTATSTSLPQLFYRRAGQSIAVCGQLLATASNHNTNDLRTFTRTFYFTVTVRT